MLWKISRIFTNFEKNLKFDKNGKGPPLPKLSSEYTENQKTKKKMKDGLRSKTLDSLFARQSFGKRLSSE
jgi:hypothetical protein